MLQKSKKNLNLIKASQFFGRFFFIYTCMITKFKLFENNIINESVESELVDELDNEFIEKYFDKYLAYDDFDEIIQISPTLIWNHIDDESAMKDVIYDEINSRGLEDFYDGDLRDWLKGKYHDEKTSKFIYNKYMEDEGVDFEELKDLKDELKDETDLGKIKKLKKKIKEIKSKIKEYKEMNIDDIIDELDEDTLHDIIRDNYNEYDFIDEMLNEQYKNYSLKDYIEEIYGNVDSIYFDRDSNMDWILDYVDKQGVIDEWNENEDFDHKKERVEDEISSTKLLQYKLLKIDPKNSLKLFDLFINNNYVNTNDTIEDEYIFQKAYIESYFEDYDDEDIEEVKSDALKNLYDNFKLNSQIKEEYKDYMWKISVDKYNI